MSKKLFKSTLIFSFFTFLSRIMGFIRDMVLAITFGATSYMEAFLVAFKIPNFMRRMFAEGAFSQAFIPVLSEYKEKKSKQETIYFIKNILGTFGAFLIVISSVGMAFSSFFILIFAFGFYSDPVKFNLASNILTITFPYIFFISMVAFSGAILNTFNKFAVPAFTPIILNICLIIFALNADYFNPNIFALGFGVLFAGILQLALQLPFLKKLGFLVLPVINFSHKGVKKVIRLMIPALFGASIAQISLLLDTIFASFLQTGSISWLYYADRLNQFPLGVFGIAIATVVLPSLSKSFVKNDKIEAQKTLDWAFRLVCFISFPSAILISFLAEPILTTLFQYGKFTIRDVQESSYALKVFSIGLFTFILVKVLVSSFYSRQDIKTPVKIGIIALVSNMIMNAIFVFILIDYGLGHVGLALATSLSSIINAFCLLYILVKTKVFYFDKRKWFKFLPKIIISCLFLILSLEIFKSYINFFELSAVMRFFYLGLTIITSFIIYFIVLFGVGFRKKDLIV